MGPRALVGLGLDNAGTLRPDMMVTPLWVESEHSRRTTNPDGLPSVWAEPRVTPDVRHVYLMLIAATDRNQDDDLHLRTSGSATETRMTGILGKFQVEHDNHGVRVIARSHHLTGKCDADATIDTAIEMLKDDLDACAREMKRFVALNRRGSLFEGWSAANDERLDA